MVVGAREMIFMRDIIGKRSLMFVFLEIAGLSCTMDPISNK
jgi:hypothetical protein